MPEPEMTIFDLDGTLIEGYMEREDKNFAQVVVLPGRHEHLARLLAACIRIAIATNQAGVAFGFVSEAEVEQKLAEALDALGLSADTPVAVCYNHPKARVARYKRDDPRRKPGGGMIKELVAAAGVELSKVLFVGDRPEDEQAANVAGVSFRWANDYFA